MAQAALVAVLLCFAAALAVLFRRNMAQTLPAAPCAVMAVLYLFAIFGALPAGVWAVAGLAAATLVFVAVRCIRQQETLRKLLCPGVFIFAGLCLVVAWWGQRGRMLMEYDEFSHWGRVVKVMFASGSLGNAAGGVLFPHYPPGTALLQYFAATLGGGYSEGALIGAQDIFVFALMAGFIAPARGARAKYAAPLAAGLVLLPLWFYPTVYQSLYVDPLLGLLFGSVLYGWFYPKKKDAFVTVSLSFQLFALGLVKDSGAGLGAIAVAIIAADMLFAWRRGLSSKGRALGTSASPPPANSERSEERSRYARRVGASHYRYLPQLAALAGSLLFSRYSWKAYLLATSPKYAEDGGLGSLAPLADLFAMRAPAYKYQTVINFVRRFFAEAVAEHLLPLTAFALLGLFALCVAWLGKGRPGLRVLGWGLLAGAGAYLLIMLYMYAVLFNEYEAVPLHSYVRYLGSYLLGMVLAFCMAAIAGWMETTEPAGEGRSGTLKAWALALSVALFASPAPLADVTLLAPLTARETRTTNAMYSEPARRAGALLAAGEKLAVVTSGDHYVEQTLSYHLLPYEYTPQHTGEGGLVTGGGQALAPEAWLQSLSEQGIGTVYLFAADEAFLNANAAAFGGVPEEGAFYTLAEENGELCLVPAGI